MAASNATSLEAKLTKVVQANVERALKARGFEDADVASYVAGTIVDGALSGSGVSDDACGDLADILQSMCDVDDVTATEMARGLCAEAASKAAQLSGKGQQRRGRRGRAAAAPTPPAYQVQAPAPAPPSVPTASQATADGDVPAQPANTRQVSGPRLLGAPVNMGALVAATKDAVAEEVADAVEGPSTAVETPVIVVTQKKKQAGHKRKSRRRKHGKYAQKARSRTSSGEASDEAGAATGAGGGAGAGARHGSGSDDAGTGASGSERSEGEATGEHDWDNDDLDEITTHTCCHSRRRFPAGATKEVTIHHVTITIKGKELLNQATVRIRLGRRYGLVGRNGVGKTTLLRRLARGAIEGWPEHLRCFHVKQEAAGGDETALRAVLAADVERDALLAEEAALMAEDVTSQTAEAAATSAARLAQVLERLDDIEAHTAEERATAILKGLQFSAERMAAPTRTLSGGWRMRVSLARALFLHPDVLMLDEPTNHLDLPSVLWLQAYLALYDGCVMVVSHDRAFLNAVTTDTIHFHKMQLHYYPGNYDAFAKARADKLAKAVNTQNSLDRQRAKWEAGIKKMAAAASKNVKDQKRGQQVAQRRKKLDKWGQQKTDDGKKWNCQKHGGMRPGSNNENAGGWHGGKRSRRTLVEIPPPKFTFNFPADIPVQGGGPLLQLRTVSFSYPPATEVEAARRAQPASPVVAFVGATAESDAVATAAVPAPGEEEEEGVSAAGAGESTGGAIARGWGSRGGRRHRGRGGRATAVVPPKRGPHLLNDVTLNIECRSRIGILGANGAGKSTLLALLSGALQPASGEVKRHHNLKVAQFTQHHVDQLNLDQTPIQHMASTYPGTKTAAIRSHLGAFGLGGVLATRPIGTLSGGQKSRVVFATVTFTNPHILILDEPTNHLDFDAQEALQDALAGFDGGVILVSHSQSLISSVCTQLYEVRRGFVKPVPEGFGAWVQRQVDRAAARIASSTMVSDAAAAAAAAGTT